MKQAVLALVLIVGFGGYIFWSSRHSETAESPIVTAATSSQPIAVPAQTTASVPVSGPKPPMGGMPPAMGTSPMMNRGRYIDGIYPGEATGTIFGVVQVAAVISGGKLVDVTFLQFPNDRPNSIAISEHSLPILRSEAIAAQSVDIDNVSGATQTWEGFVQSLSVALAAAKS